MEFAERRRPRIAAANSSASRCAEPSMSLLIRKCDRRSSDAQNDVFPVAGYAEEDGSMAVQGIQAPQRQLTDESSQHARRREKWRRRESNRARL